MTCSRANLHTEMTCSKESAVCFPPSRCSRPLAVALPSGGERRQAFTACALQGRLSIQSRGRSHQVSIPEMPLPAKTVAAWLISLSAPPYQREQMEYVMVLPLTGRQKKTSQAEEYLLGTPKKNIKLGRHMGKRIPKPGSFFHSSVCCGYLFPFSYFPYFQWKRRNNEREHRYFCMH